MSGASVKVRSRRAQNWSRIQAPSKGWRERLLRRCMEQVKCRRSNAVDAARRRNSSLHFASDSDEIGSSDSDRDDEVRSLSDSEISALIAELEASIDAEHREEEARALQEYEETRAAEARSADADIEELLEFNQKLNIGNGDDFVLCPVCQRDTLHVRNGVVFCACGMRLDGGTVDNITIDIVRERLEQVVSRHAQSPCEERPVFEQRKLFDFHFLHMRCKKCDTDDIVF